MPRAPRINCALDEDTHPEWQRRIGEMRGGMVGAAERHPMPDRFSAVPDPDSPAMIICDEATGRSHSVGLYAYGAVREALQALFGEGEG